MRFLLRIVYHGGRNIYRHDLFAPVRQSQRNLASACANVQNDIRLADLRRLHDSVDFLANVSKLLHIGIIGSYFILIRKIYTGMMDFVI